MKQLLLTGISLILYNVVISASGYLCVIGGGTENYNSWSDKPYRWIVEKAYNGRVIVLSYSTASDWIPNYFISLGADSSENFIINSRDLANKNETFDRIAEADAVFIREGDQSKYIEYWKGTRTEEAIIEIYKRGGVISGTGAGAMILSEIIFTEKRGSVLPGTALNYPKNTLIEFENDFIGIFKGAIFDTHFAEKGRIGRQIPFLLKYQDNTGTDITGIGIDDKTALCIDNDTGYVFGTGSVTIIRNDLNTLLKFTPSGYRFSDIRGHKLLEGWRYNFKTNQIISFSDNSRRKNFNKPIQLPSNLIFLTGNNDFTYNFSVPFNEFRLKSRFNKAVFILNSGYYKDFSNIEHSLQSVGINFTKVLVSGETLNDNNYAAEISNSDAIIFLSNNLSELVQLCNRETPLGNSIFNSIESGVPLMFFGEASKLISPVLSTNIYSEPSASYLGELKFANGLSLLPIVFQPGLFYNPEYYENNITSAYYSMMTGSVPFTAYFDYSDYLKYNPAEGSVKSTGKYAWLVVDARESSVVDSSIYTLGSENTTRQIIGIDNIRYTASKDSLVLSRKEGSLVNTDGFREFSHPAEFILRQNYPNPFNQSTTIEYSISSNNVIPVSSNDEYPYLKDSSTDKIGIRNYGINVKLAVYDLLGCKITTLVNSQQKPGNYRISFNAAALGTGVYLYSLETDRIKIVRKMIYLK